MKYIIELKDDELGIPISIHDLEVALAFDFGLARLVSVKHAVQQQSDLPKCPLDEAKGLRENQKVLRPRPASDANR